MIGEYGLYSSGSGEGLVSGFLWRKWRTLGLHKRL